MKTKYRLWLFVMFTFANSHAQYQTANWPIISYGWILKIMPGIFKTDTLPTGAYGFIASAAISSPAGELLMYSLGNDVRNKTGDIMDGGECCFGESVENPQAYYVGTPHMQGALILPRPGSSTQYYLFIKDMAITHNGQPSRVTANLIDLTYNNGLGKVIQKGVPILNDTLSDSRMTACRHANGRDWWLVNHEHKTNRIYTNLINDNGFYGPYVQHIGAAGTEPDRDGWSAFSPAGNKFATVTAGMGSVSLFDFDRCTGTFSNYVPVLLDSGITWMCYVTFAPTGRFLYVSNDYTIYQYDMESPDISLSRMQLVYDTATFLS